ncbi:hypothetical protein PR048_032204 [Dryococelus australis]|uniref:Uncharacterized protein n=1 Tax=Dryococelus australis TaxID=614101 RepID=A0ABQ9G1J8_9NEOP|nr:hypothetical protein PR048_032204 [Dryococelus australis]
MLAYTCQKAKSKYRNRIRLETAPQKQSSNTHKTPYDRVKRCRERKINIKTSERVNVDVFTQNKRPCPKHSQTQFCFPARGNAIREAGLAHNSSSRTPICTCPLTSGIGDCLPGPARQCRATLVILRRRANGACEDATFTSTPYTCVLFCRRPARLSHVRLAQSRLVRYRVCARARGEIRKSTLSSDPPLFFLLRLRRILATSLRQDPGSRKLDIGRARRSKTYAVITPYARISLGEGALLQHVTFYDTAIAILLRKVSAAAQAVGVHHLEVDEDTSATLRWRHVSSARGMTTVVKETRVVRNTQHAHAEDEPMKVIDVSMEQRRNERAGETEDPRENLLTNDDSHMRNSGVTRPGIEPGSPWWERRSYRATFAGALKLKSFGWHGIVFTREGEPHLCCILHETRSGTFRERPACRRSLVPALRHAHRRGRITTRRFFLTLLLQLIPSPLLPLAIPPQHPGSRRVQLPPDPCPDVTARLQASSELSYMPSLPPPHRQSQWLYRGTHCAQYSILGVEGQLYHFPHQSNVQGERVVLPVVLPKELPSVAWARAIRFSRPRIIGFGTNRGPEIYEPVLKKCSLYHERPIPSVSPEDGCSYNCDFYPRIHQRHLTWTSLRSRERKTARSLKSIIRYGFVHLDFSYGSLHSLRVTEQ